MDHQKTTPMTGASEDRPLDLSTRATPERLDPTSAGGNANLGMFKHILNRLNDVASTQGLGGAGTSADGPYETETPTASASPEVSTPPPASKVHPRKLSQENDLQQHVEEVVKIKAFGRQKPMADDILKFCANPSPFLTRLMKKHGILAHILQGINTVEDVEYKTLLMKAWPTGIPMSTEGIAMIADTPGRGEERPLTQSQNTPADGSRDATPQSGKDRQEVIIERKRTLLERLKKQHDPNAYAKTLAYMRAFEASLTGEIHEFTSEEYCPYHEEAVKFVRAFKKKMEEDRKAEEENDATPPDFMMDDDLEIPPTPSPTKAAMENPFRDFHKREPTIKEDSCSRSTQTSKADHQKPASALRPLSLNVQASHDLPLKPAPDRRPSDLDNEEKNLTSTVPMKEGSPRQVTATYKNHTRPSEPPQREIAPAAAPHIPTLSRLNSTMSGESRPGYDAPQSPQAQYKPEVVLISDSEDESEGDAKTTSSVGNYAPSRVSTKRKYAQSKTDKEDTPPEKKGYYRMTLNVPLPVEKYLTTAFYDGDRVYTRRFGDRGIYAILTQNKGGEAFIQKMVNGRVVACMYLTMPGVKQLYQNALLIKHSFQKLQKSEAFEPLKATLEKGKTILIRPPYTTFNIRDWEGKQFGKFAFRGIEVYEFVDFLRNDLPRVFPPISDVEVYSPPHE